MAPGMEVVHLLARQAAADSRTIEVPLVGTPGHCATGNDYDGLLALRISAIFVILVGSLFGTLAALTVDTSIANSAQALGSPSSRNAAQAAAFSTDSFLQQSTLAPASLLQRPLFMLVLSPLADQALTADVVARPCERSTHKPMSHWPHNNVFVGGGHRTHYRLPPLLPRADDDALRQLWP